ncbi:MAG: HAMP domain-containing histidine kinase [Balneolaceae bacterium]|nr:HAMP domain-containing histidine kinase [Balneolaceae bacterium]
MTLFAPSKRMKIILVSLLLFLGIGSVVYSQYLITEIRKQERKSVELLARALEFSSVLVDERPNTMVLNAIDSLRRYKPTPYNVIELLEEAEQAYGADDFVTDEIILEDRFHIPTIVVDSSENINFDANIDSSRLRTPKRRAELVREYKSSEPIKIVFGDKQKQIAQWVYYGESPTVQLLRYYPYLQFLLLALLFGIGYTTYRSISRAEQSNLWVGMAKEAAHQLGTPISSLYGWIQLLKDEYRYDDTATNITKEIEKDIQRLKGVAERFGKIGSEPELQEVKIGPVLNHVMAYIERRLPKLGKVVDVRKSLDADAVVRINPELFQWAIENLLKNSLDALQSVQNEQYIAITSTIQEEEVIIDIEDSGKGIDIKDVKNIFKPGFSTKKRGWGLGLSLTKRIIEEYHSGSVFVLRSELDEGTTIRVTLNVVNESED